MDKNNARKAAIAATVLVAVLLAVLGARHFAVGDKPHSLLTAKVARGDLVSAVLSTGSLQAQQQVDVGARVSGQLKSLKVRLGDRVEKGQLLAEIDPVLLEQGLRSARASLASLGAQRSSVAAGLWQAELALRRQQQMIEQEATSRQELEAANAQVLAYRGNLAAIDAQINQARSQVDSAQTNLEYTKITAPMAGEVVAIVTQEGQTVVAVQQAPVILKLANLDVMTVKAQVSEADVIRIQPGQTAYFNILGDAAKLHYGKVAKIEPVPQELLKDDAKAAGPVFYNALFDVANPDHQLRIAMTAQVTVVLDEAKNVLSVPLSALGKAAADGRYPVRVLDADRQARTVMVAVGINDRVSIQILDGLREGDEVIIEDDGIDG